MVESILLAISMMWVPVGLVLLGKGDAKGTGALVCMVGALVLLGAILQAAVFKDPFIAALLFAYGLFYSIVGFSLYSDLDMTAAANASFTLIPISIVYMLLAFFGGPVLADGKQLIGKSNFLALACAGYTVLYVMVWLNGYGKFSGKALGVSLLVWTCVGLWVPSFWLMAAGRLPF